MCTQVLGLMKVLISLYFDWDYTSPGSRHSKVPVLSSKNDTQTICGPQDKYDHLKNSKYSLKYTSCLLCKNTFQIFILGNLVDVTNETQMLL